MWQEVITFVLGVFFGIILNERANRWWIAKHLGITSLNITIQQIILRRIRGPAQIAEHDIMSKEDKDETTR